MVCCANQYAKMALFLRKNGNFKAIKTNKTDCSTCIVDRQREQYIRKSFRIVYKSHWHNEAIVLQHFNSILKTVKISFLSPIHKKGLPPRGAVLFCQPGCFAKPRRHWKWRSWGKRCRRHLSAQVADLAQQIGATRRPPSPPSIGAARNVLRLLHYSSCINELNMIKYFCVPPQRQSWKWRKRNVKHQ